VALIEQDKEESFCKQRGERPYLWDRQQLLVVSATNKHPTYYVGFEEKWEQ